MTEDLTRVDSAVSGLSMSPKDEKAFIPDDLANRNRRRTSSLAEPGVWNIKDLEAQQIELVLPIETQKTGWYVYTYLKTINSIIDLFRKFNTSPMSIEDTDILKLHLVNPPVKKIDLHFPLGLAVVARNPKGVTVKDAMDAIYKQFKKKADDELDLPYLAGFEWNKKECWTRLVVHGKIGSTNTQSGKTKKKNKGGS